MVQPMPEAKGLEILVMMQVEAVLDRVGRYASCLKRGGKLFSLALSDETTDEVVQLGPTCYAGGDRVEFRIADGAQHRKHRAPLLVIGNRDRYPAFFALAIHTAVGTVWRVALGLVSSRPKDSAGGEIIDQSRCQ